MSNGKFTDDVSTAREALGSFLATLLGAEVPLDLDEPVPLDFDDAAGRSSAHVALRAGTKQDDRWAVLLDPAWIPVLSTSVLGEPIELGDAGTDDLLKELAAQAYEAVRTQFASHDVSLPEADIQLLPHGSTLDENDFPSDTLEVRFKITHGDQDLRGFALIPAPPPEPVSAEPEVAEPVEDPALSTASGEKPPSRQSTVEIAPAAFPELGREIIGGDGSEAAFSLLSEVDLEVTVELGRRKIQLADVLRLTTGSVIELEKLVGEPLEVYANGRLIAEGEAVVMDEQFGIRITNLTSNRPRTKAFA